MVRRISITSGGIQCDPHHAMRIHERGRFPLLLSEGQEFCCKLAQQVAVERAWS
jgi:hypothetical protein